MKNFYVAQFKGRSLASKAIKYQTADGDDDAYSHSAWYLDAETKSELIAILGLNKYLELDIAKKLFMEQWPHGDSFMDAWFDFSDYSVHTPGTEYDIWELSFSVEEYEGILKRLIDAHMTPYDWRGILHFRIKAVKEDPEKTFCSEQLLKCIAEEKGWDQVKAFNYDPNLLTGAIQMMGGKLVRTEICSQ